MLVTRTAEPGDFSRMVEIDDDASRLFAEVGISFDLAEDHPFARAERSRWRAAVEAGRAWIAALDRDVVGMMVLGTVDGARYLDQLAVLRSAMRRGVGRALMQRALAWDPAEPLWLNTYAHVPWNGPYYLRWGFAEVPESAWGPEMQEIVATQRAVLPEPARRIVMRRSPRGPD